MLEYTTWPGLELCLPLSCGSTYLLQANDTCATVNAATGLGTPGIQAYNTWINYDCSNLQKASNIYGHVLCLSPQGGTYSANSSIGGYDPNPFSSTEYGDTILPPPIDSTVAPGTTALCGGWYIAGATDTCTNMAVGNGVTYSLFLAVNPSLPPVNCTAGVVKDLAYCVHPVLGWNRTDLGSLFGTGDPGASSTTLSMNPTISSSVFSTSTLTVSTSATA